MLIAGCEGSKFLLAEILYKPLVIGTYQLMKNLYQNLDDMAVLAIMEKNILE
jgi:hypothetical protein